MIARSLLSLLAVAAVAMHTCVASAVENGIYRISPDEYNLVTSHDTSDSAVFLIGPDHPPGTSQDWRVENVDSEDSIVIRNVKTGLYLAPRNPKMIQNHDETIVSRDAFIWSVYRDSENGKVIVEHPNDVLGELPMVLGVSPKRIWPPRVDTQWWNSGNQDVKWVFERRDGYKQGNHRCGPWRIQRDPDF
ncbi:MAG: hypothetical protein J3Q66DRAFT_333136 [Benniella sp.]|nr:MAG: hypothetical protein J3Q66DRAFT_333136 [Benniella sp.]